MAYRFPSSNHHLHSLMDNRADDSSTVTPPPIFSVPPPPVPPLPFIVPPLNVQQCHNFTSQIYNMPQTVPSIQNDENDFSVSVRGVKPQLERQANDDEMWLRNWLSNKKQPTVKIKTSTIPFQVCQTRDCIKNTVNILHQLKSIEQNMSTELNTMDSASWESLVKDIQQKAVECENLLSKFENSKVIEELKKALVKRTKKRKYQKRRRLLRRELHSELLGKRLQLHRSIDNWLADMQGAVEKAKIDESLKEEADTILSDVTRKKAEARRQLSLLSALLKLHQLRVKTAASKGEHISAEHGIRFCKVTDHLQKLWEKQLKEYNLEEQGLRVMLSEAVDERDHSRVLREKRYLKEWERLLFGEKQSNVSDFYTAAENDIEAFIKIRQDWDKFITSSAAPMSSAIPIGWVLPTVPSSAQWESVLSSSQSME